MDVVWLQEQMVQGKACHWETPALYEGEPRSAHQHSSLFIHCYIYQKLYFTPSNHVLKMLFSISLPCCVSGFGGASQLDIILKEDSSGNSLYFW